MTSLPTPVEPARFAPEINKKRKKKGTGFAPPPFRVGRFTSDVLAPASLLACTALRLLGEKGKKKRGRDARTAKRIDQGWLHSSHTRFPLTLCLVGVADPERSLPLRRLLLLLLLLLSCFCDFPYLLTSSFLFFPSLPSFGCPLRPFFFSLLSALTLLGLSIFYNHFPFSLSVALSTLVHSLQLAPKSQFPIPILPFLRITSSPQRATREH